MKQSTLFDGEESKDLRNEALARVAFRAGPFMGAALAAMRTFGPGLYTAEDFRLRLEREGLRPHHHNAWGALTKQAILDGIIRETGSRRAMRDPRSHARMTPVYRKG